MANTLISTKNMESLETSPSFRKFDSRRINGKRTLPFPLFPHDIQNASSYSLKVNVVC